MFLVKLSVVFICLFALLIFRFQQFYKTNLPYHDGQHVVLITTLQTEPDTSNKGQKFTIKTPINQLISVTASSFPQYHYGQVVMITGDLSAYTFSDGRTIFTLYHPKITLRKNAENIVSQMANEIRFQTRMLYESVLPPVSSSLLMGMVFGANETFPADFKQALQTTGVLHVIAASGMNVTFVSAALLYTLGFFFPRKVALFIGSLGIIFYVFLVGFQASILRAGIMGLVAFGAGLLGRQNVGLFAVFISAYLLLLWQPSFLFDVGFQLSFLATLGIMFLKPLLDRLWCKFGKFGELGGETITTTIAAQLGTLPVLLGVFGQIGLVSILVNALVLWTIPFVMVFGSIAAIIGLAIPPFGQILLYPSYPFLLYFEIVVSFFGKHALVIHSATLSPILWIGYYLLLAVWVKINQRSTFKNKKVLS